MNFNVYVDKRTAERLNRLARARRTTRNALVREALTQLLEPGHKAGWPAEVLEFQGIAGTQPFEEARRKLRPPRPNPLG